MLCYIFHTTGQYNHPKFALKRGQKNKFQEFYGVLLTFSPAAASTLEHYFKDTNNTPDDYDIIYTGDLGIVGTKLLYELCDEKGIDIRGRHSDCGTLIFNCNEQDVHSGGSGCGCSASVLCSYIMHRLEEGKFKNILFMSTGALMSPTSSFQGESIPGIAHLINIKMD